MRLFLGITLLFCLLLAPPAWAGQKLCDSPAEDSRATFDLPGGKQNTLYIKGDPKGRFLIRFNWVCRKGHIYREAGPEIEKIPLGHCFQSGKMNVSVRQGCVIFEVDSERSSGRGRR